MAHDTIEPTEEWRQTIETALLTCHAAVALVTTDFCGSMWCDQEIGYCLARSILVVPVMFDAAPHGFLGKYQAIKPEKGQVAQGVAQDVFRILATRSETRERMAPSVVRRFSISRSVEHTRGAFTLLNQIPQEIWTSALVEEVEKATKDNHQIREAVLRSGKPVPEAAEKLLRPIKRRLNLI